MPRTSLSALAAVGASLLVGAVIATVMLSRAGSAEDASSDVSQAQTAPTKKQSPQSEGGVTGIVLIKPMPLREIAPLLVEAQLQPIEYSHQRPSEEISGGFVGRGLPLAQQIDEYRAAYQASSPGDDPSVVALVVEGSYDKAELGPLAAHVAHVVRLPGG